MDFYNKIFEMDKKLSSEQKMNIHFNSLKNFILHYNEAKKEKSHITILIQNYIEYLESKDYNLTNEESLKAYYFYINELGKIYSKHSKFSLKFNKLVFVVFTILPNAIIWFVFRSIAVSIIILIPYIYLFAKLYQKYKKGKIYGLKW